jgi:hypothetical protein
MTSGNVNLDFKTKEKPRIIGKRLGYWAFLYHNTNEVLTSRIDSTLQIFQHTRCKIPTHFKTLMDWKESGFTE